MGGALSLGWPLLDIQGKQPRLKCKKSKVGGREMHELEYSPKKGLGDFKIKMYFDPETFRHVRTEYGLRITAAIGAGGAETGKEKADSIYRLLEQFDDFREVEGMMLPHRYTIDLSIEGAGSTFLARWIIEAKDWIHNGQADPQFFEVK
jgi:hypothetical protein